MGLSRDLTARHRAGRPDSNGISLKPITVTVPTALAVTGLGRTKFYELVKEGRIRTIAIGRRTLVIFADLEKLADAAAGAK
jgi:excisionase family DNA binding protein